MENFLEGHILYFPPGQKHSNHDQAEMCKLLRSNAGKHKVDIIYHTTGNLTPKFQSKRCATGLLAIANAQLVKRYGFESILSHFLMI